MVNESFVGFPETVEPHKCPNCGVAGTCDYSEHAFFAENKVGLRCRACRSIWRAGPRIAYRRPGVPPVAPKGAFDFTPIRYDLAEFITKDVDTDDVNKLASIFGIPPHLLAVDASKTVPVGYDIEADDSPQPPEPESPKRIKFREFL